MSNQDISSTVVYKNIPDFPGYQVGSDGSVRSIHARFGRKKNNTWHLLKQTQKDNGYLVVGMRRKTEQKHRGKVTVVYVHRLVLEVFVGPCPEGMEALHGDGTTTNNRLENLRWGTRKENSDDARRHGTMAIGSRTGSAVLSEKDIPIIRTLHQHGFSCHRIAHLFGVTSSSIYAIIDKRTWKHVS